MWCNHSFKPAEGETVGAKTYYATNGNVVTGDNKWVEFKANDVITWLNLPVGTYFVEEDEDGAEVENYTLTVSYSDEEGIEVKVLSEGGDAPETTVNNTYDQHKGSLIVKKSVTVLPAGAEIDQIKWKIAVKDDVGNYYKMTGEIVTGDAIWNEIGADESLTFKNLPVGTYTVEEDKDDAKVEGFTLTVTGEGEVEVAYDDGSNADFKPETAEIVNTYKKDLGSLTVTKTVVPPMTGAEKLEGKTFRIAVVTVSGEGEDAVTTYYDTDGKPGDEVWVTLSPNTDGLYDAE